LYICPVCNGVIDYIKYCPRCGDKMSILDRVENYYDDYSPYLSYELTDLNDGNSERTCTHMSVCRTCGYKTKIFIENIIE
jgi:hypothetical protein